MKIRLGEKAVSTSVYMLLGKLLLYETVCHLLRIVSYHSNVQFIEMLAD